MKYIKYILNLFERNKLSNEERQRSKLDLIVIRLANEKNKLLSLLPKKFQSEFKQQAYISGGCIYSLYNDTDPKDYDFFIKCPKLAADLSDYFKEVSEYKGKSICGGVYKKLGLTVTDNAISIGKYQIITQWVGTPEEVVGQFDFKHLQFFYQNGVVNTLSSFNFLSSNQLVYNEKRARDICGTIVRTSKFLQRGMKIKHKEMGKILLKLSEIGFSDREMKILNDINSEKHFGS
ncbi:hypothetical protein NV379_02015 [Paenibacillus sp. N1-5-1-14]|uniref:hypothetical protein n=1 Tax=Paenibacillus radicibacter TaxID=2972488 RepID=UPI0021594972|nr:hypothetical protein [Paenibacillus radicibacter]MCR8641421.1 hypothetical protein [Paenibacillus radicibacter]